MDFSPLFQLVGKFYRNGLQLSAHQTLNHVSSIRRAQVPRRYKGHQMHIICTHGCCSAHAVLLLSQYASVNQK